jgi:hypothetical protein
VTAADGGLPFPAGEVLVRGAKAPGRGQVAVISASSRGSSIMPFIGQGSRAPYYHRLFALPGNSPRGPALTLPFGSHTSDVSVCWSADERFVVYTDLFMNSVSIIDLSGPSGP